ncbi:helix-turn-helix domain-containing protein [Sinomonas susongensis]|uniref:helix-turn-helix domain-containing protein n=1 Tax=Sinomonas susongensis TaxID=1324851 RepID=UPI00110810B7|nr:helix-turn-helix transcriptional regulator [Sinomonas susongensis]
MSNPPNTALDPNDVAVGNRIAEALLIKSISVLALAEATGISRSNLQRSIKGSRPLNMREFLRISRVLGIAPEVLIPKDLAA